MDYADQVTTCYATCFTADGRHIVAGSGKSIHFFEASRPGRPISVIPVSRAKGTQTGQSGPISALVCRRDSSAVFAAGSFSASIGIYDARIPEETSLVMLLPRQENAITQLHFSQDGWGLYDAARKTDYIARWDLRMGTVSARYGPRSWRTNQRIFFHLDEDNRCLFTGDQQGNLLEFPLDDPNEEVVPTASTKLRPNIISCVSGPPLDPSLLAMCNGERTFDLRDALDLDSSDNDAVDDDALHRPPSSLSLYRTIPHSIKRL